MFWEWVEANVNLIGGCAIAYDRGVLIMRTC